MFRTFMITGSTIKHFLTAQLIAACQMFHARHKSSETRRHSPPNGSRHTTGDRWRTIVRVTRAKRQQAMAYSYGTVQERYSAGTHVAELRLTRWQNSQPHDIVQKGQWCRINVGRVKIRTHGLRRAASSRRFSRRPYLRGNEHGTHGRNTRTGTVADVPKTGRSSRRDVRKGTASLLLLNYANTTWYLREQNGNHAVWFSWLIIVINSISLPCGDKCRANAAFLNRRFFSLGKTRKKPYRINSEHVAFAYL